MTAALSFRLGVLCWFLLGVLLLALPVVTFWSGLRRRTFCPLGKHRASSGRVYTSTYAILLCRDCGHQMKYRELQAADFERGA